MARCFYPVPVLVVGFVNPAVWANDATSLPPSSVLEQAAVPSPQPAIALPLPSSATAEPYQPHTSPAIESGLSPGVASQVVPPSLSKAAFVQRSPSRRAVDLLGTQPETAWVPRQHPMQPPEPSREWLVAATQLPLLTQPPLVTDPLEGLPAATSERSPSTSAIPASFVIAADPANPTIPPTLENCDPELGCLRFQNLPFPTQPQPVLYLTPRVDFFRSNNLLLGIDPINAGLIRPSLTLLAIPRIGPNTFVLASVDGAFSRYFEVPQFSFDELRIRAGILHQLSPTMAAEVGWTNQQLFIANNEIPGFPAGTRFLNDQAVRFELSRRDQLAERLFLNSIYQFRVSFSDPEDRSRILNVAFLSLNYDLNPNRTVQLGVDYQFSAANYTVVKRTDIYQQLLGRITFNAFRNSQLSVYGGISFGNSTEPGIDFGSYVLGVSMSVNWTIF